MDKTNLAVIILNWNSWVDTCECLASLLNSSYQNFQIVLIDNGSTDNSLTKIRSWAKGEFSISVGPFHSKAQKYFVKLMECSLEDIEKQEIISNSIKQYKILLIPSPYNLGFARGCNVGIRYALVAGFKNILLLNNDTALDPNCLGVLTEFIEDCRQYDVVTPRIYYYDRPEIIWYFGGKLTFTGRRKFYYANKKEKNNEFKEISFVSGCALFARTKVFKKFGLLSEKFFFGEEDYEFSLRMRKNRVKMLAISYAKLYHKVGVTNKKIFNQDRLPYVFIGYLNRFIDKKLHCNVISYWKIWRLICLSYILPKLVIKDRYDLNRIVKFAKILVIYSNKYDQVDNEIFFQANELLKQK